VARAFAASLAAEPIPGLTVYVLPVLNVSGYDRKQREEKGYDPNRDYPGPCGSDGPFRLQSTAALARFVEQEGIVSSATLHTFYPAVVYPWGITTRETEVPQLDLFRTLAESATRESRYQVGNSTDVIYPANGTFEDYAYWKHGMWSLLFELGFSHSPGRNQIVGMAEANVTGLRRFLETAPRARTDRHAFTGECDYRLLGLDRRDE
jgi:carboxypeptidase T